MPRFTNIPFSSCCRVFSVGATYKKVFVWKLLTEKDNFTCFPKQESGSEIRSNQQLPASCGFIKSGKIALIVAHRAKLSHQNDF